MFSTIPPEVAKILEPYLGSVSEELISAIRQSISSYARPENSSYEQTLRLAVEQALNLFVRRIEDPRSAERLKDVFEQIGRGEAIEGRSLEPFNSALRLGARTAWQNLNLMAARTLSGALIASLGSAMLVHIDEIAAATSSGYDEARLRVDGELQRRRLRLLDILVADPPASVKAIRELAEAAQWQTPRELSVVLVDAPPAGFKPIVPAQVLVSSGHSPMRLLFPGSFLQGSQSLDSLAVRGGCVVVGSTVALTDGARSLRHAMGLLSLAQRGVIASSGVIRCTDHLSTLLLFQDESLIAALEHKDLSPLREVRPQHRQRLAETLLAWLQCNQNANETAAHLRIHPQTVRYRLKQLKDLLGDRLQDIDTRFEMELILRRQMLQRKAHKRKSGEFR
ncbi:PucR family transcriptional regulator [Streptomyces sp. NPDC058989]|uniref:PucR family transcriptional regulator n=1 Tax=Streptomyces sp. NPDC058989 TaxID=3346686 RepID=UPI0036A514E0